SYYVDNSDSIARVVTSGGSHVQVYQVLTSPSPALNLVAQSSTLVGSSSGFFTTVSSNGASNAVIWALSRPASSSAPVYLYAFNPDSGSTLKPIYKLSAGTWPYTTGRSNLVPVVADGEVFVASYQNLNIFGLTKAVTHTTFSSGANPANYGQSVTLTAQVTSASSGTPTGTVTFKNGIKTLGTVTLSGGTAVLSTTALPLGSNFLTATYNGDSSNSDSQTTLTETVNPATIMLSLSSSPNPSLAGKLVKFTATLTSNGGLPKEQHVTFSYNRMQLGTASISAAGTASFSTKTLPDGTDTVTATYAGNADYSAASGSAQQTVN
ncbi:MAG: Ig-like domain-containing protein, partial [Terriglobales bacterium]